MKRMFGIVIVLLIFYVVMQVAYIYMAGKQINTYKLTVSGNEYQITETFTNKHKNKELNISEQSNYYYEIIKDDKLLFSFKLVGNYMGKREFLNNLIIYKDENIICAYPIFKDKVDGTNVICNDGAKQYLYDAIKGQNFALDKFVVSLKNAGYSHLSWNSVNLESRRVDNFDVYSNNLASDINISLWQYKGFYRITSKSEKLFSIVNKDQYEPILTALINQYYVMPDYKKANDFDRFFITNFISGAMDTFELGLTISYNSFIQGIVDNKIYLIDCNAKKQYAIDIYAHEIKVVGDVDSNTKYYSNGKWYQKPVLDVIDKKLAFEMINTVPDDLKALNPLRIDEVGGTSDGYYYLYLNENNAVGVYLIDKQNTKIMTLLFRVPSVNNIQYVAGDIYFISNDTLYVYRNTFGLRPLIKYDEFISNKSDLYKIYIDQ